jgi:hypothetical protein
MLECIPFERNGMGSYFAVAHVLFGKPVTTFRNVR